MEDKSPTSGVKSATTKDEDADRNNNLVGVYNQGTDKPAPARTKGNNNVSLVTTAYTNNNRSKGASMIPKATRRFRSRQGSKKRAAALVDELSKSVGDLSRLKSQQNVNHDEDDDEKHSRASMLSKSCEYLDREVDLQKQFPLQHKSEVFGMTPAMQTLGYGRRENNNSIDSNNNNNDNSSNDNNNKNNNNNNVFGTRNVNKRKKELNDSDGIQVADVGCKISDDKR
jgi:hypothetical protein